MCGTLNPTQLKRDVLRGTEILSFLILGMKCSVTFKISSITFYKSCHRCGTYYYSWCSSSRSVKYRQLRVRVPSTERVLTRPDSSLSSEPRNVVWCLRSPGRRWCTVERKREENVPCSKSTVRFWPCSSRRWLTTEACTSSSTVSTCADGTPTGQS